MKSSALTLNFCPELASDDFDRAIGEIVRAISSINYGSVEVTIQNSRVVQIERKEKFRLDKS